MFTALANARQMVKLFNDQGLGPWEASRVQRGGGGWGQYLDSELGLPPEARTGFDRGYGAGGGANEEFYQGMAGWAGRVPARSQRGHLRGRAAFNPIRTPVCPVRRPVPAPHRQAAFSPIPMRE